eukprot:TRINITY_DN20998_c0_g1_i1.p1 TRINITY_DN20998_c0_g1~~TRINITY_DN20998_c0_g1_i1.p1  ORF type:complete len:1229 (+),score=221.74 TRINITY_DN20998_c0_g1_i1:155-3841(+)
MELTRDFGTALLQAVDPLLDERSRLEAAISLRVAVRDGTVAKSVTQVRVADLIDAILSCVGTPSVARQLEALMFIVAPPLLAGRKSVWEACASKLLSVFRSASADIKAFGESPGSPTQETCVLGLRALMKLLSPCLLSLRMGSVASEEDDGDADEVLDNLRQICNMFLPPVLDLATKALRHFQGDTAAADFVGTACKFHARVLYSFYSYDPSFESDNMLPSELVSVHSLRGWCELQVSALTLSAARGKMEASVTLRAVRAAKWAARSLCAWAALQRSAVRGGLDGDARNTLLAASAPFVSAQTAAAIVSYASCSQLSLVRALSLRYLRRCVEVNLPLEICNDLSSIVMCACPAIAPSPAEWGLWKDHDATAIVCATTRASAALAAALGDVDRDDFKEDDGVPLEDEEACRLLVAASRRNPQSLDGLARCCLAVLEGASGEAGAALTSLMHCCGEWRWDSAELPPASPPPETLALHLAMRLAGILAIVSQTAAGSRFRLNSGGDSGGDSGVRGGYSMSNGNGNFVGGGHGPTETQRILTIRNVWMPAQHRAINELGSFNAILQHDALRLLARLAPLTTRVAAVALSSVAVECNSVVTAVAARLNELELPTRHAAVGACAAWLRAAVTTPGVGAQLSGILQAALEAALQCGESLADDSFVATEIQELVLCGDVMGDRKIASGSSEPGLVLDRLLNTFFASPLSFAGGRALAAAAAFVRLSCGADGGGEPSSGTSALLIGLTNKLRPALERVFLSQTLLMANHIAAFDGLELCCKAPAIAGPLGAEPSTSLLLAKLFHLLCGGFSAEWPMSAGDAHSGIDVVESERFARVFCWLLAYTSSEGGNGCQGSSGSDACAFSNVRGVWAGHSRSGLQHTDMAACVIRRLLGVSAGDWLSDPRCDPGLPEIQTGVHGVVGGPSAASASSRAAAAHVAWRLFELGGAEVVARCGPAVLSAALQAWRWARPLAGSVPSASTVPLLEICAVATGGELQPRNEATTFSVLCSCCRGHVESNVSSGVPAGFESMLAELCLLIVDGCACEDGGRVPIATAVVFAAVLPTVAGILAAGNNGCDCAPAAAAVASCGGARSLLGSAAAQAFVAVARAFAIRPRWRDRGESDSASFVYSSRKRTREVMEDGNRLNGSSTAHQTKVVATSFRVAMLTLADAVSRKLPSVLLAGLVNDEISRLPNLFLAAAAVATESSADVHIGRAKEAGEPAAALACEEDMVDDAVE